MRAVTLLLLVFMSGCTPDLIRDCEKTMVPINQSTGSESVVPNTGDRKGDRE